MKKFLWFYKMKPQKQKVRNMILGDTNMMFRTLKEWDSKTFGEVFGEITITDENKESVKLLKKVLMHQGLMDKKMNGFCTEGLKKAEFERMGVRYVDFFNELESSDAYWTPLDILHNVCKNNLERKKFYEAKAKKYNMSFDKVTWLMCGRALRALPSYMREYQLRNALENTFEQGTFYQDEELDKKYHCDIKMDLNDKSYYFWSFYASTRSIFQFADKFKGNRYGEVLNGCHVLCPFDREQESEATYKGWLFYSKKYVSNVKKAILDDQHLQYKEVLKSSVYDIDFYKKPVAIDKQTGDVNSLTKEAC